MGTSNFHNENASAIFACELPDEFAYEDLKSNLESELGEFEYDFNVKGVRDPNELRSFPSTIIGHKTVSKSYCGVWVELTIHAVIRSGYYEGCNLDWFTKLDIGGCDFGDDDELKPVEARSCLMEQGVNPGMARIQSHNIVKWFEKERLWLIHELEFEYRKLSTPLGVAAKFSNGETWYELKNK